MADDEKPLIEYPTEYTFKVMGKDSVEFDGVVRGIVEQAVGAEGVKALTRTLSSQKNYVSLTVVVELKSEAQRQLIYTSLHHDRRILYYL